MNISSWLAIKAFFLTKLNRFKNRDDLLLWQEKMWERHQRNVLVNSPFYSRYVGKPLSDWPVMGKKEHMEKFNSINTASLDRETALTIAIKSEQDRNFTPTYNGYSVGLSSGTSGNRGLFVVSENERAEWAGTIVAKILPFKFQKQKIAFFLRANNNLYETVNSKLIAFKFFDLKDDIEDHIKALNLFKPDILIGPAQILAILAKYQRNKLSISPSKIISVAEVLEENDKVNIESAFTLSVSQVYQCTEGFLGNTCEHGNLHLNEDIIIVEKDWIDADKTRFVPIITDFKRSTQPIIRYRLDDILVEEKEICPCGSPFTRLKKVEGRCDDIIKLTSPQGDLKEVFPDFIRNAIIASSEHIEEYQVSQIEPEKLLIKLYPLNNKNKKSVKQSLIPLWQMLNVNPPNLKFDQYVNMDLTAKKRRVTGLKHV